MTAVVRVSGINSQLNLDGWSYKAALVEMECTHSCLSPLQHLGSAAAANRPQAEAPVPDLSCPVQA